MNAAFARVQIDAISIWLVSEHESPGNEWMCFDLILFSPVRLLKSDQVSLTAESALITGDLNP